MQDRFLQGNHGSFCKAEQVPRQDRFTSFMNSGEAIRTGWNRVFKTPDLRSWLARRGGGSFSLPVLLVLHLCGLWG